VNPALVGWSVLLMGCPPWTLQLLALKDMFVMLGPTPVLNLIFSALPVTCVTLGQLLKTNSVFCVKRDLGVLLGLGLHKGIDLGVSRGSTAHLDLCPVLQKQASALLEQPHYRYQLQYPIALLILLAIYVT